MRKTILFILFVFLFTGCQSVGRAVVPDIRDGVVETRDDIARLGERQTDLALTGQRIEGQSADLAAGIENLERAIGNGTANDGEFEDIIRDVRERPIEEVK